MSILTSCHSINSKPKGFEIVKEFNEQIKLGMDNKDNLYIITKINEDCGIGSWHYNRYLIAVPYTGNAMPSSENFENNKRLLSDFVDIEKIRLTKIEGFTYKFQDDNYDYYLQTTMCDGYFYMEREIN